jgi:hypothetical protein
MTDIDRESFEESYFDFNKLISNVFGKFNLVIMILIIILNIMICFVLIFYGNVLAFMFMVNIFYIISYYRLMKKEKIKNELG